MVLSCRDSFSVTSMPERMWNLQSAKESPFVLRGLNRSWNPTSADASVGQVMQQQEIFILALKRLIILFNTLLRGNSETRERPGEGFSFTVSFLWLASLKPHLGTAALCLPAALERCLIFSLVPSFSWNHFSPICAKNKLHILTASKTSSEAASPSAAASAANLRSTCFCMRACMFKGTRASRLTLSLAFRRGFSEH